MCYNIHVAYSKNIFICRSIHYNQLHLSLTTVVASPHPYQNIWIMYKNMKTMSFKIQILKNTRKRSLSHYKLSWLQEVVIFKYICWWGSTMFYTYQNKAYSFTTDRFQFDAPMSTWQLVQDFTVCNVKGPHLINSNIHMYIYYKTDVTVLMLL